MKLEETIATFMWGSCTGPLAALQEPGDGQSESGGVDSGPPSLLPTPPPPTPVGRIVNLSDPGNQCGYVASFDIVDEYQRLTCTGQRKGLAQRLLEDTDTSSTSFQFLFLTWQPSNETIVPRAHLKLPDGNIVVSSWSSADEGYVDIINPFTREGAEIELEFIPDTNGGMLATLYAPSGLGFLPSNGTISDQIFIAASNSPLLTSENKSLHVYHDGRTVACNYSKDDIGYIGGPQNLNSRVCEAIPGCGKNASGVAAFDRDRDGRDDAIVVFYGNTHNLENSSPNGACLDIINADRSVDRTMMLGNVTGQYAPRLAIAGGFTAIGIQLPFVGYGAVNLDRLERYGPLREFSTLTPGQDEFASSEVYMGRSGLIGIFGTTGNQIRIVNLDGRWEGDITMIAPENGQHIQLAVKDHTLYAAYTRPDKSVGIASWDLLEL